MNRFAEFQTFNDPFGALFNRCLLCLIRLQFSSDPLGATLMVRVVRQAWFGQELCPANGTVVAHSFFEVGFCQETARQIHFHRGCSRDFLGQTLERSILVQPNRTDSTIGTQDALDNAIGERVFRCRRVLFGSLVRHVRLFGLDCRLEYSTTIATTIVRCCDGRLAESAIQISLFQQGATNARIYRNILDLFGDFGIVLVDVIVELFELLFHVGRKQGGGYRAIILYHFDDAKVGHKFLARFQRGKGFGWLQLFLCGLANFAFCQQVVKNSKLKVRGARFKKYESKQHNKNNFKCARTHMIVESVDTGEDAMTSGTGTVLFRSAKLFERSALACFAALFPRNLRFFGLLVRLANKVLNVIGSTQLGCKFFVAFWARCCFLLFVFARLWGLSISSTLFLFR